MRLIDMIKGRNLGHIALEVSLIVIGVLLALALQGWWEDRNERLGLVDSLVAFEAEIIASRDLAESRLNLSSEFLANLDKVMAAIAAEDALPDSFSEDLGNSFLIMYSPALRVAYDDLISTGSFRHIENPDLRRSIAVLNRSVEYLYVQTEYQYETYQRFVLPLLIQYTNIDSLFQHYYETRRHLSKDSRSGAPDPGFPLDDAGLKSRASWNALSHWRTVILDNHVAHSEYIVDADEVLRLIRAEIEALE